MDKVLIREGRLTQHKLLLVHHFPLHQVSGVTVMMAELLRLLPTVAPTLSVAHQSYIGADSSGILTQQLQTNHLDTTCMVGINLHIEVAWKRTLELFDWCQAADILTYIYIHDYWQHHCDLISYLQERYQPVLMASTTFIHHQLVKAGFEALLIPAGVVLPALEDNHISFETSLVGQPVIGAVGRLVCRKRFTDIVRAFAMANIVGAAKLHMTLLPSLVYAPEQDLLQLQAIEQEIRTSLGNSLSVQIQQQPTLPFNYQSLTALVCASDYEGFGMPPIEAAYAGCPPIVSDIPPHRASITRLFPTTAEEHLYPVGNCQALADRLADELLTGRRRLALSRRLSEVQAIIEAEWSLQRTARELATAVLVTAEEKRSQMGGTR